MNEEYYNLLGVNKDSTKEEIDKAYTDKVDELNIRRHMLSLEEYNQKIKELERAYGVIVQKENDLTLQPKITTEKDGTQQLEDDLKRAMEKEKPRDITVKRGRLIRKIQAEIKKIKNSSNITESDKESLKKLEELLENELDNHKRQLSTRYKYEFLDKKATVSAIFTVLPKGLGLQVKKINNCINELKQAKSNKERIFGVVDLAKSLGMLVATPIVFTAKFIVQHWYLLLLLLLLLPKMELSKFQKQKDNQKTDPEPEPELVSEPEIESVPKIEPEAEPVLVPNPEPAKSPEPRPTPKPIPVPQPDPVTPITPITSEDSNPIDVDEGINDLTVIDSTAKDEYFSLLRQALPAELSGSYTVFDTYQDAINYCVNEMGYSAAEAESILNGTSTIERPSIMWLVGKGGFFAESETEMLQNYTTEQLQQIVEENSEMVNKVVSMNEAGSSVADILSSMGPGALALFVCYELLQYGLAIPTGGVSLLAPG